MHFILQRVFDHFPRHDIGIIGSAVKDPNTANDIDVLLLSSEDLPALAEVLGVKYSGWDRGPHHIRRANVRFRDVVKPVQITQDSAVAKFEDHPYAVLLRNGTVIHEGKFYEKSDSSSRPASRHTARRNRFERRMMQRES